MAIQEGFSRYQCDCATCTKRGYLQPGSQGAAEYVTRQYMDANGQVRTPVLCSEHSKLLTELMQRHDAEYDALLKTGKLPETTTDAGGDA